MSERRRKTMVMTDASAGCFLCTDKIWLGEYAQANAAKHYDAFGHTTWCLINRTIRYGEITDAGMEIPQPKIITEDEDIGT